MRVLVTRPAGQAVEWVAGLRAAGIDAIALPLIGIAPASDLSPLQAAWSELSTRAVVMFVSPNAAVHFFAARPAGTAWPAGVIAASPGPGTTAELLRLGVDRGDIVEPPADAAQFDSEALWRALSDRPWHGARVLVVRGTSGRDWLATQMSERGAHIDFVAAYRRAVPEWAADERAVLASALSQPAHHLWFFSSSEAIDHLEALAAGAEWSSSRAFATHPRIAARARALGLSGVAECRPSLAAVVACIQSLA